MQKIIGHKTSTKLKQNQLRTKTSYTKTRIIPNVKARLKLKKMKENFFKKKYFRSPIGNSSIDKIVFNKIKYQHYEPSNSPWPLTLATIEICQTFLPISLCHSLVMFLCCLVSCERNPTPPV